VSSTATTIGAPAGNSQSTTKASSANPTTSADQRAWLKNQCARL